MLGQIGLRPRRPIDQFAPAIGAAIVKRLGTGCAEGAFERTDECACRRGGQVGAAAFTIGAHFEHGAGLGGIVTERKCGVGGKRRRLEGQSKVSPSALAFPLPGPANVPNVRTDVAISSRAIPASKKEQPRTTRDGNVSHNRGAVGQENRYDRFWSQAAFTKAPTPPQPSPHRRSRQPASRPWRGRRPRPSRGSGVRCRTCG